MLFCAALVWAWWGTIDIVASATGKIVPSGRTKVVQPFETGVVRAIQVQDGQAVKAGDVLIELDPTVNAAERDHLRTTSSPSGSTSRGCARRLRQAMILQPISSPPAGADPDPGRTQRQLLLNQVTEHRAKIAALARQQAQKEAEQATTAATIHKLEAMIPVIQQRVDIRKTLMEKEARLEAHLFRDPAAAGRAAGGASASRTAICTKPRRPSPRSARRAARPWRNIGARSPTNWPKPSRRPTGSRRI